SHLDYLLVSYILYKQKLSLPYILAGINLNFWPIGGVFRNCGAFFMRRVFKGKRIYSKALNVYVSTLLREGINIEFFVEGGRSRTGKLIPPKLGFISILLDAFRLSGREDMAFVPVTVDYERVFEEGFYLEEAGGKKKKRGKLRTLIQNRHIIRRRIGHVDVTFAQPILLSDLLRENGHPHVPDDRTHQMSLASIIAAKTTWSISEHLQARPYPVVITALMATAKRGMLLPEVIERVELMMEYLHSRGARIQGSLWRQSDWVKMMLDLAEREKFIRVEPGDEDDDDTIIYLEPERRLLLTLRRNALLHHYQDVALLSTALLSAAGPIEIDALYERFQRIKHLLRLEMVYGDKPVQTPGEERGMFDDALEYFSGKGELAVSEQGLVLSAAGAKGAELFSAILVSYLESYYIVARTFWKHRDKDANDREWLRRCNKMGTFLHGLDEIVFPEAIHKNHFENAIKQLSADGALGLEDRVGEKSKLERRIVVTDEDKLEDLLNELRTFIAAR
ncbi:1-acyl-sn-glycerol-3-phosphate acyltransferase, partial [bacterium]|nr:1-acyl-sn-glycerol-3-phosphate acyltransferase [bacterium]